MEASKVAVDAKAWAELARAMTRVDADRQIEARARDTSGGEGVGYRLVRDRTRDSERKALEAAERLVLLGWTEIIPRG
jgi:hypothetical protein